jgi:hypothetical protein
LARREDDRDRYVTVQAIAAEMLEVALGCSGKRRLKGDRFALLVADLRTVIRLYRPNSPAKSAERSLTVIAGGRSRRGHERVDRTRN